jgi:hypothetical protein
MPYSLSNPAVLIGQGVQNAYPAEWLHQSNDAASVVQVAGFISNGERLGMKVGDFVTHRQTTTDIVSRFVVKTANATTGAVDLTNATADASGTNSD